MNRFATVLRWALICGIVLSGSLTVGDSLYAQSGLRKSLERLDTNHNGVIEPNEVTPLARPYLERITRERRMSLNEPNQIHKLQEAARVYSALQNGISGKDVRPEGASSVVPFGPQRDENLVPEFGLAKLKYPYTQADLDFADRTMRSHDRNRDGYIDRAEAARNKWTHRNPFDDDLDKDNRLNRLEMAQRYARRRLLSGATKQLNKDAWRAGDSRSNSRSREGDRRDSSQRSRSGGSGSRLASSVMGRFDSNRNGRLELREVKSLGIPAGRIDVDRDGELSRGELQSFLTGLQDEAVDPTEELPSWFHELDADGDGQVELSEFAVELTNEKLEEFASLDTNGDGLVTSSEVSQSKAVAGGSYVNEEATVLPPRRTIISEIEVSEDYLVGDLNVQISITHSSTSYLDAYLTGPDGQRIELFTEVGGSDDNFDQTVLDDQSRFPIRRARPPFKGTFMPEALEKKQPSLSHFNGKSVKGVWQLVVRGTRSERFGLLHGWGLIVKPQATMKGVTASPPTNDGPQQSERPSYSRSESRRPEDNRSRSTSRSSSQTQSNSRPDFARPESRSPSRSDADRERERQRERERNEARKREYEKYRKLMEEKKRQAEEKARYDKKRPDGKKDSDDKKRYDAKKYSDSKKKPEKKKPSKR